MIIRKAVLDDIDRIMEIVNSAKEYFRTHNIPQWQDGYPNEYTFKEDILAGNSYVLEETGKVMATMAIIFDGEPTYDTIYDGTWLSTQPYAAIHRVAVDSTQKGKGYAGRLIDYTVALCKEKNIISIKNDTHQDNLSMQNMVKKNGFTYCGIIYLENGEERIAFERVL